MEHRGHNYYEANSADVNLEEITSSAKNAKNLQQLRDGDPRLIHLCLSNGDFLSDFCIGEGDDLGGWVISSAKVNTYRASILTTCPTENNKCMPSRKVSPAINLFGTSTSVISTMMDSHQ